MSHLSEVHQIYIKFSRTTTSPCLLPTVPLPAALGSLQ